METIFYISIGLILGGLIGVLIFKLTLQKNFVSKIELETLQTDISTLRVDNATRLSKDEVANNYVSKELHDSVNKVLTNTKEELQKEKQVNQNQQETIVQLTGESEKKLSRADVEQNYVAKETFDIVNRKLTKAESDLTENNQTILDLNNQLTKLQEQEENLNEKLTTFKTEVEALHDLSKEQFKNLATDILEEKKNLFVQTNKTELNSILDPFKTNLTEFKDKVEATRKEDIQDMTSLKKEIESLQKLNTQLSDDAKNLSTALKSEVKMQGSWGEERLNMILEVEGLQKYIDFTKRKCIEMKNKKRIVNQILF